MNPFSYGSWGTIQFTSCVHVSVTPLHEHFQKESTFEFLQVPLKRQLFRNLSLNKNSRSQLSKMCRYWSNSRNMIRVYWQHLISETILFFKKYMKFYEKWLKSFILTMGWSVKDPSLGSIHWCMRTFCRVPKSLCNSLRKMMFFVRLSRFTWNQLFLYMSMEVNHCFYSSHQYCQKISSPLSMIKK